jgi:hypothetical protein
MAKQLTNGKYHHLHDRKGPIFIFAAAQYLGKTAHHNLLALVGLLEI